MSCYTASVSFFFLIIIFIRCITKNRAIRNSLLCRQTKLCERKQRPQYRTSSIRIGATWKSEKVIIIKTVSTQCWETSTEGSIYHFEEVRRPRTRSTPSGRFNVKVISTFVYFGYEEVNIPAYFHVQLDTDLVVIHIQTGEQDGQNDLA